MERPPTFKSRTKKRRMMIIESQRGGVRSKVQSAKIT